MDIITENSDTSFELSQSASERIKILLKDEKAPILEYLSWVEDALVSNTIFHSLNLLVMMITFLNLKA